MKTNVCCFTGHRIIADDELPRLKRLIDKIIEELIGEGVIYYGSGGAIGFDTPAALAVLKQREKNPAVKLIMVLPCRDQDVRWGESDRHIYRQLLNSADKIVYVSERCYDGCMAARNRYLVEHSGVCVAYMKRTRSGTGQTVRLAQGNGARIISLWELGISDTSDPNHPDIAPGTPEHSRMRTLL